ncbi:MAG: transposase family protein [Myxococcales bacterium]|nr:transposase family protein [Myxococcales bacterium]
MARATKAQKIEIENELAALQFFERMLAGLTDPRRPQGLRYPLRSVVVIALMSMVCSCDNAESKSMELWGELNEEWLTRSAAEPIVSAIA